MDTLLFVQRIGWGGLILIVLAILLLFGGKKLPELMKGLGKGIKGFKDEMNSTGEEKEGEPKDKSED